MAKKKAQIPPVHRCLELYARLCEGKVINKAFYAKKWEMEERTIQRDIDKIRNFLSENREQGEWQIVYKRAEKGFVMQGRRASWMSKSEILAVSKILLASRAFTKEEIGEILEKLIMGCVPEENGKLVRDLISNETYHYMP
ncbi:MAG: WYL domain-containing protein, partial [Lachnospiraceae bacterium]|nr:WYL domain-containing protein [Lachnospiraceae bacterium]